LLFCGRTSLLFLLLLRMQARALHDVGQLYSAMAPPVKPADSVIQVTRPPPAAMPIRLPDVRSGGQVLHGDVAPLAEPTRASKAWCAVCC
jgi:hypothetical protein